MSMKLAGKVMVVLARLMATTQPSIDFRELTSNCPLLIRDSPPWCNLLRHNIPEQANVRTALLYTVICKHCHPFSPA